MTDQDSADKLAKAQRRQKKKARMKEKIGKMTIEQHKAFRQEREARRSRRIGPAPDERSGS
jgi:hypothetical protein